MTNPRRRIEPVRALAVALLVVLLGVVLGRVLGREANCSAGGGGARERGTTRGGGEEAPQGGTPGGSHPLVFVFRLHNDYPEGGQRQEEAANKVEVFGSFGSLIVFMDGVPLKFFVVLPACCTASRRTIMSSRICLCESSKIP